MKKYFAKYLPVEGEIKDGDYYHWAVTNTIQKFKALSERKPSSDCTKMKLYLCSRDIQVDDEYYNEEFEFTKYPNKSIAGSQTEFVGVNGSYKTIGEISPEAAWVKEGDEFDEDEIMYLVKDLISGDWRLNIEPDPTIDLQRFAILGPCKHFH